MRQSVQVSRCYVPAIQITCPSLDENAIPTSLPVPLSILQNAQIRVVSHVGLHASLFNVVSACQPRTPHATRISQGTAGLYRMIKYPQTPRKGQCRSVKVRRGRLEYHCGGVPVMIGIAAGAALVADFGVALPLPDCEERFAACCAACIFLRREDRRDLAPSMTR